jgi:hypothetical protein
MMAGTSPAMISSAVAVPKEGPAQQLSDNPLAGGLENNVVWFSEKTPGIMNWTSSYRKRIQDATLTAGKWLSMASILPEDKNASAREFQAACDEGNQLIQVLALLFKAGQDVIESHDEKLAAFDKKRLRRFS